MADELSLAYNTSPTTSARYCYIITDESKGSRVFYTGADFDITLTNIPGSDQAPGGSSTQLFTSIPIAHGGNRRSQEFENNGTSLILPKNNQNLGKIFLSSITAEIRVKIIRLSTYSIQPSELEWGVETKVITEGVITNMSFDDNYATATVIPEAYAKNFSVPRIWFTRSCNHVLYGEGCGVDPELLAWDTSVITIDRQQRKIKVIGVNGPDIEYYVNGTIKQDSTGVQVTVVKAEITDGGTNLQFITNNWLPEIQDGDGVRILPGCARTKTACHEKFANAANFGGFPYIPNRNSHIHGLKAGTNKTGNITSILNALVPEGGSGDPFLNL